MGWQKREAPAGFTALGDGENQVDTAGGLLAAIVKSEKYDGVENYEVIIKDGTTILLAGCAALNTRVYPKDVGKFIKCEFTGWGNGKNGKFKEIEVSIWGDEPTDDMKKWPHYDEVQATLDDDEQPPVGDPPEEDFGKMPDALDESSDDLPF